MILNLIVKIISIEYSIKELPYRSPIKERLIITYSPKYAIYQKKIRDKQVQRAMNKIRSNGKLKKRNT